MHVLIVSSKFNHILGRPAKLAQSHFHLMSRRISGYESLSFKNLCLSIRALVRGHEEGVIRPDGVSKNALLHSSVCDSSSISTNSISSGQPRKPQPLVSLDVTSDNPMVSTIAQFDSKKVSLKFFFQIIFCP